jgi:diguanylate cyclase (GGDEF)-like protein
VLFRSLLHQVVDRSLIPALSQANAGENGQFEGYYHGSASSKKIWILMLTRPLFDKRGQVRGGIAIVEDITDRKLANDRLKSQLAEIKLLQAELHERSLRDPLTGLYNRRFLQETLPREFARLERMKHPLGMIMADIDHFKLVDDTYGHDAGDLVLKELRKIIIADIRANDIACRYGGEEFVIVMPDADLQICQQRAEEIRAQFDALFVTYNNHRIHNTISLGVAAYPLHGLTGEVVLNCADQALYKAKQAGRNRVVVFGDGDNSPHLANE